MHNSTRLYIFISLLITIFILFLLFNVQILTSTIQNNIQLFLYKLFPAVFPFIFFTNILIETKIAYNLSYGLKKVVAKLFNIPIISCPAVIIGGLLGYPNAAKFTIAEYTDGIITTEDVTCLAIFTSNANPAYIISTIGITMYSNIYIGIILCISHLLSSLILGIATRYNHTNIIQQKSSNSYTYNIKNISFEIISRSIFLTLKTVGIIFTFMTLFSCMATLICTKLNLGINISAIVTGIFEITNGMNLISNSTFSLETKLLLSSFILSFGSFMIIYQIYAVIYTAHIPFFKFLKGKILHGILSSLITAVIISIFKDYIRASTVFSNISTFTYISHSNISYILAITCFLLYALFHKKR